MLLSLFSGCGGLDLGFEQAGFNVGLAYDIRPKSIASWNANRPRNQVAQVRDINKLTIPILDTDHGSSFQPTGVIGGPPCQSFTNANTTRSRDDPRSRLVSKFVSLALKIHEQRNELDFIAMENVVELGRRDYKNILDRQVRRLKKAGFDVKVDILDACNYQVPQYRRRLFLLAINEKRFGRFAPNLFVGNKSIRTVQDAIGNLPEPIHFRDHIPGQEIPIHKNHWCMTPKSPKFFDGTLTPGYKAGRSFRTLRWDAPSPTVCYGHREVHVHPSGSRRLSVYEGMLLQGFPKDFVLEGTLSDQINQVSEAVPPPLARAVAETLSSILHLKAAA